MKKLIFVLIVALSVTLTGCSAFDSAPIEPEIIGSANLQYDAVDDIWYVKIGSIMYSITEVTIPNNNPRISASVQNIAPIEGMLVTLFTSPSMTGIQAVEGRHNAQQIEDIYRENYGWGIAAILTLFLICIVALAIFYKCDKQMSNKYAKN